MSEKEKKDKQDRMIELLGEMLTWVKVTSIPQVKKLLLDILPSDEEKIAYHFSDGMHNGKEVATIAGVATGTISNWWKVWARSGIAETISVKGGERARRTFSLEDFGIKVPKIERKPEAGQAEVFDDKRSEKENETPEKPTSNSKKASL